jgi:phosphatidylglycerophosphate synthase
MPRTPRQLVIDARPRGPRGPLAVEPVQGRSVLEHLLDLAAEIDHGAGMALPVMVHARADEHEALRPLLAERPPGRFALAVGPPPEGAAVLRADRLYDPARLRRALRRGRDPETAVVWRLDQPHGLAGADAELVRRQTFQPLGRYWAIGPARTLARALAPTRVRPNAVTLAAAGLVLGAAAVVAFAGPGWAAGLAASTALALGLVLDTADGHLARLQGTASEFGRWLDGWLDEVGDMALHAAAAWSAYTRTGSVAWLLLGMLYAMGKFLFVAGSADLGPSGPSTEAPPARREGGLSRWVRLAGHADVRWHLWIALAAVGRLDAALAAYAVYFPARAAAGAVRKAVRHG